MKMQGVIVPLITPFKNGEVDYKSYEKLVNHYISEGVHGLIPLATTGESPTISENEYEKILEKTMECVNKRIPVYVGLGGNNTKEVISKLDVAEKHGADGILSVAPYYSRPSQKGIYEHFKSISESTDLDIMIYNIPYRTGVNVENETLYKLVRMKNIVGVKDCSGNMKQTIDFLMNRPDDFSILTGEDAYFYTTLVLGGDGGIMASASLNTKKYIEVYNSIRSNDYKKALGIWNKLYNNIHLLFKESNPAPIKYCLRKIGLIETDELRLPLVNITSRLENELNTAFHI